MTNPIQLLPLLEGWRYDSLVIRQSEVIRRGTEKETIKIEPPFFGWIDFFTVLVDRADTEIILRQDDRELAADLNELVEYGLVVPNPDSFWLSRFDQVANRFAVAYTPTFPSPFRERTRLAIKAPVDNDVTLFTYQDTVIRVIDRDRFEESLRRVSGAFDMAAFFEAVRALVPGLPPFPPTIEFPRVAAAPRVKRLAKFEKEEAAK